MCAKLRPVILANMPADPSGRSLGRSLGRDLERGLDRGLERVARQRRRAIEALHRSERESGAELAALDKNADDAPLASNGWHWSISHTSRFSAGVVSRAPIGIDIERIARRRIEVVAAVASPAERGLFAEFGAREFVRVWTAKEAVLKKAGVGLAELSSARVLSVPSDHCMIIAHRGRRHLAHQWEHDGHVAAISSDDDELEVHWTWEMRDAERGA
jgi:4'-phosphopantetheinyl transferase